jgi:hypothetical protein
MGVYLNMTKSCIIIGGGKSVREGIASGLWEKIKDREVWGLNYTYKLYPHKLSRLLFVDNSFFKHNQDDLHDLASKGVPIFSKKHSHMKHIPDTYIKQYETSRNITGFKGKEAFKEPPETHLFIGLMGLCGIFSLSLAIAEHYNTIYLVGFDQGPPTSTDKDTHWYQGQIDVKSTGVGRPSVYWDSPNNLKKQYQDYKIFTTVPDIKIYNVSPKSNIPYFPKIDYSEFYRLIGEKDVQRTN